MRALALALALVACTTPPPARTDATATIAPGAATTAPGGATGAATAWRRIPDIPTPRSEVAAAVFRDVAFVIGGFGGPRVVESLAGTAWRREPDLPIAVDHPMAAASDVDQPGVYVFGGNSGGAPTARAFRFFGGTWTELAPMPEARSQAAAVFVGGRFYVLGGVTSGPRLAATTLEYDPAANAWRARAAIPTPRDHLGAAPLGGRACAVGGRRLSMAQNLATLECYDPAADSWERLADAPTARGGVGAATIGGRLMLVGGEQPSGTFKEVEAYDAATRSWSRLADLPTARHGIGVVAVRSTLYVLTGGPTPGGSQTAVCEALDIR